jgi:hypothetical protein
MHLLHEEIYVLATPICPVHTLSVLIITGIVRDGDACNGIWIEVIIKMDTIYIVTAGYVASYLADPDSILGTTGIKEYQTIIVQE